MKKLVLALSLLSVATVATAQTNESPYWQPYSGVTLKELSQPSAKNTIKKHTLLLDETALKNKLTSVLKSTAQARSANKQEIDLPLTDGRFVKVYASESPILSAELAEKYPDINTWRVVGVNNPAITGRIDFTSKGFHGMLVLADGDTIYIDPEKNLGGNVYSALSKRANKSHFHNDFNCQLHKHGEIVDEVTKKNPSKKDLTLAQVPAKNLKTYRFAVAGTGEYTASQGGTSRSAYASMVTTVNRVNQIYQRDLGIRLELVNGEELLYTDAATDPYTSGNPSTLISDNMANMTASVGLSKFDLGHVFTQGGFGGLAYLGVACLDSANTPSGSASGIKAGGTTGIEDPQGEIFSVEYVAHEVGHQLGANHTFNGTGGGCGGNRTADTAVEPGSGSTVMSYSGLCGTDNLQYHAEAYFHFASIEQINEYTRNGYGNTCGTDTATGNQKPTASAGLDAKIPAKTPFMLDGSATGGSSYTWDQIDTGSASAVDVDTGDNAIIRSLLPSSEQDRYIPRLSDLFNGTKTIGEKLPQTTRALNFAYVVRDGNGGVASDEVKMNVTDTHSTFSVVSQATNETLLTGQRIKVIWNTAGTNTVPINCANVDIQLLRENGTKNMLLAQTKNDGSQQLTIPEKTPTMSGARIMVACSNQPFFNISTGNITIEKGQGSSDTIAPVITLSGAATVTLTVGGSYTDAGATAVDDVDGTVTVTVSGAVDTSKVGTYTITYKATDAAGNSAVKTRTVKVVKAAVVAPDTTAPVITLNGAATVTLTVGGSYTDAGATAVDDVDGTVKVTVSGAVDTSKAGTYTITYKATDAAGNSAVKTRTVKVVKAAVVAPDTTAPVITLNGDATMTLTVGDSYTDAGATAVDDVDGTVTVTVSGIVDTSKAGTYTITYKATDAAGNSAVKTRTVKVKAKTVDGQDNNTPANTSNNGNDNTGSTSLASSSGGGSFGFLLMPLLALVRLRQLKK